MDPLRLGIVLFLFVAEFVLEWSDIQLDYCDGIGEFLVSPGTLCSFMCGLYIVIDYDALGPSVKNGPTPQSIVNGTHTTSEF